jgi:dTMP kinase
MRYKHPLICVEGLDASGKFTTATYIAGLLGGEVVSFPRYHTTTGKLLLAHLKGEWVVISTTMCGEWTLNAPCQSLADMMVRQALMSVNRYEAQSELLAKLEERPVVLDRYHLSSEAYGAAEGLDQAWLRAIGEPLLKPDLTIVLDLPPELVAQRRPQARDRNERDLAKLRAARERYQALFAEREGIEMVDASEPLDTVKALVRKWLIHYNVCGGSASSP